MNRWIRITWCLSALALFFLVVLPGCNRPTETKKDVVAKGKGEPKKDEHDHGETGPHGGPLAEWDDVYHAEFTVDPGAKQAIVYILDDKAKAAPKIDPDKITKVKLTITSVKPFITIDLKHDAKASNEKGIAFVGSHDHFAKASEIQGEIAGFMDKPYTGNFTYKAKKGAGEKSTSSIRDLYLNPGGLYTLADIKANGNTTAADKFKDKEWAHESKKAGDKICPVTKNKAESECAWIVQGQRYEFCCPPCVDKFMRWAHYEPGKVKDAKEYVFKGM